ncbi:MAG: hypothetical protein GY910_21980 [bacterium]|nr:hypothetical protein [bacterium]
MNVSSDNVLINLRARGEIGYKIPRGGLFKSASGPNYLGEIGEWIGFALRSWSVPGVVDVGWVSLTLFSIGLGTHRGCREEFGDRYPGNRKAILSYLV